MTEKKAAIPFNTVVEKLRDSHTSCLPPGVCVRTYVLCCHTHTLHMHTHGCLLYLLSPICCISYTHTDSLSTHPRTHLHHRWDRGAPAVHEGESGRLADSGGGQKEKVCEDQQEHRHTSTQCQSGADSQETRGLELMWDTEASIYRLPLHFIHNITPLYTCTYVYIYLARFPTFIM